MLHACDSTSYLSHVAGCLLAWTFNPKKLCSNQAACHGLRMECALPSRISAGMSDLGKKILCLYTNHGEVQSSLERCLSVWELPETVGQTIGAGSQFQPAELGPCWSLQ